MLKRFEDAWRNNLLCIGMLLIYSSYRESIAIQTTVICNSCLNSGWVPDTGCYICISNICDGGGKRRRTAHCHFCFYVLIGGCFQNRSEHDVLFLGWCVQGRGFQSMRHTSPGLGVCVKGETKIHEVHYCCLAAELLLWHTAHGGN